MPPPEDNLFINTLTFDYPKDKVRFYFSLEDRNDARYTRIYRTNFPKEIKNVLPQIDTQTEFIYTTFTYSVEGLAMLDIDLKNDNSDFVKQYYNDQIRYYFKQWNKKHDSKKRVLIRTTKIKDNQIWVRYPADDKTQYFVYQKFTLKIGFQRLTQYPELTITYDGKSKILKTNVIVLANNGLPSDKITWVLNWTQPNKPQLCKYADIIGKENVNFEKVFPAVNYDLVSLCKVEMPEPRTRSQYEDNRYQEYEKNIRKFFKNYVYYANFYDLFPLNCNGDFISVPTTKIGHVSDESNQLAFANNVSDIVPHNGVKQYGPFKRPTKLVRYFFIYHKDDKDSQEQLFDFFKNGNGYFKGLSSYAQVPFFPDAVSNIVFTDKGNPLPEILKELQNQGTKEGYTSIAIYLTPYSKNTSDNQQKAIYYRIKEELLNNSITSQCIDVAKMKEQLGTGYFWLSLNNIAIAILAKLGGVPWRIKTEIKNELIVGVGAFTYEKTKFVASAFSFQNTGHFNRFNYFMKDQTKALAGSIEQAIKEYTSINTDIDRLIIHFYKEMSDKEFEPIEKVLYNFGLDDIPVFVISINKTESEDYVIFDKNFKKRMPHSGTFVNISDNTYLICNNTRYGETHKPSEGYPFPLKIKIDCTDKVLLQDTNTIKGLIDQVYQFSRMYWKSVRQQNLPVTVKYPEMVAEIVPHFIGLEIPDAGKNSLWFL